MELNLQIIACIYSDYRGVAEQIESESPILTGSVYRLHRGEDVLGREMVQALMELSSE
ncbi:hypothetical protein [Nostoc sp. MG11]|uniref:hypothetical protein n=1 Tax=Nostoc sp. MG11 TaxID=2721166 RepID=UPI0018677BD7|nr:hypothetical protein [Nostoc sp. MG11]